MRANLHQVVQSLLGHDCAFQTGHDNCEFVAAGAGNDVHGAQAGCEDARNAFDVLVSYAETVDLVDALEPVNVERQNRDFLSRSHGVVYGLHQQIGKQA